MDVLWHLQVDARGLKAGMAQDVRQSRQVMAGLIEDRGEKMAQVVWVNLPPVYPCLFTNKFHFFPDIASVYRFSTRSTEYNT